MSKITPTAALPSAYGRAQKLLAATNPAEQIAALPAQDLFVLVSHLGIEDALEILELATTEQWQLCIDLDIWRGDRPDITRIDTWLSALLELGVDKLGQTWEGLDQELTALVIQRHCHVLDLSLGEVPDDNDERYRVATPDRFFVLMLHEADDERAKWLSRLIDLLYRFDPSLARHTIMAARSELPAQLEEQAYRWHTGRLADLGFIDFYEALRVFQSIDIGTVSIGENTADTTDESMATGEDVLAPLAANSDLFLHAALGQIEAREDQIRIGRSVVLLANHILSALRISPGESDAIQRALEQGFCTLSLATEYLSGGAPAQGAKALQTIAVSRLHRVGVTLARKLASAAQSLAVSHPSFDADESAVIDALDSKLPRYPLALDTPGSLDSRPIASRRDMAKIAERLTEMAAAAALTRLLLHESGVLPPPEASLQQCLDTSVVVTAIDSAPQFRLLRRSDLDKLAAWWEKSDKFDRVFAQLATLTAPLAIDNRHVDALFERVAGRLAQTIGAVDLEDCDPRFLAGLLFDS